MKLFLAQDQDMMRAGGSGYPTPVESTGSGTSTTPVEGTPPASTTPPEPSPPAKGGSGGTPPDSDIPAAAKAAGYDTETLGPNVTIGQNWEKFNQFGVNPDKVNATQNADGSVTVAGGGDTYGGQLQSDERFGGGFYVQGTMSETGPTTDLLNKSDSGGWPGFWALPANQAGKEHVETDFMEMDTNTPNSYGTALHVEDPSIIASNGSAVTAPEGTDLEGSNTYGFLWKPATKTQDGEAEFFLNGQQVGKTTTWDYGSNTGYAALDDQQMQLFLGSGTETPMTVSNVQVWQANANDDVPANN